MEFLYLLKPSRNRLLNKVKQTLTFVFLAAFVYGFYSLEGKVINYINLYHPSYTIMVTILFITQVLAIFTFAIKYIINTINL